MPNNEAVLRPLIKAKLFFFFPQNSNIRDLSATIYTLIVSDKIIVLT